ncbi:MAG: DUF6879 family protein [Pseudonocardiaceae bacterium]
MRPPEWAVGTGKRLDLGEFGSYFLDLWRGTSTRFLKLECWQTYQEPSARSLAAFNDGDLNEARRLLKEEAEADRPLYEDVQEKGIDFARIRLIQRPLTPYLKFEFMSYQIRQGMGETIGLVELANDIRLPTENYFDFLLFDRSAALVHDYGDDGLQRGGWHTDHPSAIVKLEETAESLRRISVDLKVFLAMDHDG